MALTPSPEGKDKPDGAIQLIGDRDASRTH